MIGAAILDDVENLPTEHVTSKIGDSSDPESFDTGDAKNIQRPSIWGGYGDSLLESIRKHCIILSKFLDQLIPLHWSMDLTNFWPVVFLNTELGLGFQEHSQLGLDANGFHDPEVDGLQALY
ncbi:hypothetical protein E3N88_01462 [Mikania micrantha]|uniref:Uncharacterized protein n=1 Tax=Mikania micrantha TaxID=192012 RepID=A0A5N6Q2M4_9ASTR|nr:hypothetical protein E3N88_01462 [Mikania micrantha]